MKNSKKTLSGTLSLM